ncbi:hypothetical protein BT96DRAFT_742386, partial [Gymnopus androsaceus JB14]
AVTNNSIRKTAEWFQRSNETISKSFKAVLFALIYPDFRMSIMNLPPPSIPECICRDPKLYPFFGDCIGSAD